MFAHWLISSGRSRYELIHFANERPMIVSDVGRTTRGSDSSAAGIRLPSASFSSRWWVTTAISLAKPSTCSASSAM